ncbi:MAG: hypothetical protein JO267_08635 [Alphaproteobacteria bacterium]|nr:hypothetical protein [Alphaproteobacteria bacterium]
MRMLAAAGLLLVAACAEPATDVGRSAPPLTVPMPIALHAVATPQPSPPPAAPPPAVRYYPPSVKVPAF